MVFTLLLKMFLTSIVIFVGHVGKISIHLSHYDELD